MKKKAMIKAVLLFGAAGLVFLLAGCSKYKNPTAVWNPQAQLGNYPSILSIQPPSKADAGVLNIVIKGTGFSPDSGKNTVFFDNAPAQIKSYSDTELVVYRPAIINASLTIKVMVENTIAIAFHPGYGISEVARLYGKMPAKNYVLFLASDDQDNLYVLSSVGNIYKTETNEITTLYGSPGYKPKTSDMKIGPDDSLYIQPTKTTTLYEISGKGKKSKISRTFAGAVSYFDFDKDMNVYGAGDKTGIYVVKTDGSSQAVGDCSDLTVLCMHVYDGALYVSTASAIWRCPILGTDGSLGNKEVVMDLSTLTRYASSKILSFIKADNGDFYVSTNHSDAIFVYHPDGTAETMYMGILILNSGQLVWGGGTYFYLNMTQDKVTNDIMRISMGTKTAER